MTTLDKSYRKLALMASYGTVTLLFLANRDHIGNAWAIPQESVSRMVESGRARPTTCAANANFGGWRDAGGDTNVGFGADAQVAKFRNRAGWTVWELRL